MYGFERSFFQMVTMILLVIILVMFFLVFIKGIGQWNKNNKSPRLTVAAKVVAKRRDVTVHHDPNMHTHHHSTWYYVTFEVESGDRMELSVGGHDYGMLVEGDCGRLSFQGTRFLGFERG